jgi:ureidoglycolate lyase
MSQLIPRPLPSRAFAPFGDVLRFDPATSRPVNDGNALRADLPARLAFSAGQPRLALFRVEAQTLPLAVAVLEQHPNSSQMFFPVSADRFLVVVAPQTPGGAPDISRAEAFIGQRGQGINYHAGVWHAPIVALHADGDFLMLIWEQDTPADCLIERLRVPLQVAFDPS